MKMRRTSDGSRWLRCSVGVGALWWSVGCTDIVPNPNYCATVNGDAFCAHRHPDGGRAYCIWGSSECRSLLAPEEEGNEAFDGCIATQPPEGDACYSPCGGGVGFDGECPTAAVPTTGAGESGTAGDASGVATSATGGGTVDGDSIGVEMTGEVSTSDEADATSDSDRRCTETVQIEMIPSMAVYTGAWSLGESMWDEGEIAVIVAPNQGTEGSFLYAPDIPCDGVWYIWTRALDWGNDDSYYVTLDGEPMFPAAFKADCTGDGNGYVWTVLNWHEEQGCNVIQDPFLGDWTAGVHQIEFAYREAQAMGRILITNDETFMPEPMR